MFKTRNGTETKHNKVAPCFFLLHFVSLHLFFISFLVLFIGTLQAKDFPYKTGEKTSKQRDTTFCKS